MKINKKWKYIKKGNKNKLIKVISQEKKITGKIRKKII